MPSLISNLYEFGEFRLDPQKRLLRKGAEAVALTPKALDVLLLLIQHSGEIVSKDELMRGVWSDSFVEESNLTQTVFMLRKALGENAEQRYILNIPGRGYRFVAEVRQVSENAFPQSGMPRAFPTQSEATESGTSPEKQAPRWLIATPPLASKTKGIFLLLAMAVLVVGVGAAFLYSRWSWEPKRAAEARGRVLLAVLPFENLTGDPGQDYFSDGLTEEMISQLGNLDPEHVGVIARTSVMHYKNTQTTLDQIGRELNAQYVIEGSVRRDPDRVRITAQLIQVKDQSHVWARQYDRELKDLLIVQGEVAREIADEIQLTLGDRKGSVGQPALAPQSYEAYDLYLKGLYFFNKRSLENLKLAIRYFQQATGKDGHFARAYAGLADCYALMPGYGGGAPSEFIPLARAAALKALEIDENLPEAHTALALIVQSYDWDWATAEKEFRRAIELNPNYATAHHWYAEHLMFLGRFDEALQESERARQLDPLSLIIATDNGAILYFSRQYDRAIEKWHAVLEMDPKFPRVALIRFAYMEKGDFKEALNAETYGPTLNNKWSLPFRVITYSRAGDRAQAQSAMRGLLELNSRKALDPKTIADAYAGLGDPEQSLVWLEKAYAQHSNELMLLKVDPAYDFLRGDPRFQDLLRRVGLGQ